MNSVPHFLFLCTVLCIAPTMVLYNGGFIMDAAAELGRNPVSKHQIQPEYGDEQADAGRDG